MGPTGTISTGASRGFARYVAIKTANDNAGQPRVVNVTGDNGNFLHQYVFNPAELGPIDMNFGVMDQTAYAALSKTKIEALGDFNIAGLQTNQPANAVSASLILTADAQNAGSGHSGEPGFNNFIYPALNIVMLQRALAEVTAMGWAYRGYPTQVSKAPYGKAFTTGTNGFVRAKCLQITSRNPITMQTIVCNGSTTTFALDASPDSDGTGYTFYMFRYQSNGTVTQVTPSSVNPGNRVVTLSSAYTSGDLILILYSSFDVLAS